ncbi:MAG: hypothetical protein ACKVOR_02020 [Flavobacteriales bacterium]
MINNRRTTGQQSRDQIKARMMRSAAELWGQPNASVESFDPLVGMLIGSCATELEKVSNDLQSSQARVLERLAHLLTPEVLKGARAAHGIMHASSVEAFSLLKREFQFFLQKRTPSLESSTREEFTRVFFSPAKQVKIWDGEVRCLVHGHTIYNVENTFEKGKLTESRSGKKFQDQTLYIGIDISQRIDSLHGLSFYFDWINDPDKAHYYHLLPLSKWSIGEVQLRTTSGLTDFDAKRDAIAEFELELENDLAKLADKNVSRLYAQRFISIDDKTKITVRDHLKKYPSEFTQVFLPQELDALSEEMLWLRVEFPPAMKPEAISEVLCTMNSFPVINRRLHEFTYRLQQNNNIIPLKMDGELFYSVKSVKNAASDEYILNSTKDIQRSQAGTYLLRQGGVERFDSRTASELLNYLMDLLRDESASFALYGNDLLSANLRELQQLMNTLSQKVERKDVQEEQISYLMIKPKSASENIFVEYWGTNGEFANNLRTGAKLTPFSGYEVRNESAIMMTNTYGGRNNLTNSETLQAFRKALMTRGRIVTPNDIRLAVHQELGARVRDVHVKKGISISKSRTSAFVSNVEVTITPATAEGTSREQWEVLGSSIESMLNNETSGFYPIKVKIAAKA